MGRDNSASSPPRLFRVKIPIRFGEKLFDSFAIPAVDRNADTRGERRLFIVVGHHFANTTGDAPGFVLLGFRENQGEFVTAISRRGIDGAAVYPENIGEPADRMAADKMAVVIVNFFQIIEVEKKHGEWAAAAVGALGFVFEGVKQAAVVRKAGERIANGEMADLFEKPRVIEQRATERNGVTHYREGPSENERRIQQPLGLGGGELSRHVQPSGNVEATVKGGIFDLQTTAVPDETHQKNSAGEQLLRTREKCAGMTGDLGRETAKRRGDQIRHSNYAEQGTGNFPPRMS